MKEINTMDPKAEPEAARIGARAFRILTGATIVGGVIVGGIGFVGSYDSLRQLGQEKGFGDFSYVFPIGVDAGIIVLLGFDLLLTYKRIPFAMLRYVAWMLTVATIWFNANAGVPKPTPGRPDPKLMDDPLSAAMHGLLPVLFITLIEAARHAVRRLANLASGKAMDSVRLIRWLLDPVRTFRLWRRMKLWEMTSYEKAVGMERDRLVYMSRLKARYGRAWRRKAPVEVSLPLALTRYGEPLPPAPLTEAEEAEKEKAREAREARERARREARKQKKITAREARERTEREAREAREADREAREAAEREAHEREVARLGADREAVREARELEIARVKAESEARVNEARELARIKADEDQRKTDREAAAKARELEIAQVNAHEAAEKRAAAEAEEQRRREARERETARLATQPAPPSPRAQQPAARPSQNSRPLSHEEKRAQKNEAEREAARLVVSGSPLPTAKDFGTQYGQGETWGGDRLRAARARLAKDSAFKDQIETELLEAAYAAEGAHVP